MVTKGQGAVLKKFSVTARNVTRLLSGLWRLAYGLRAGYGFGRGGALGGGRREALRYDCCPKSLINKNACTGCLGKCYYL